jgi:hypothetical protein
MAGLNKYSDKQKREQRRRNHIARDLRTPKYRQKRIDKKKSDPLDMDYEELE